MHVAVMAARANGLALVALLGIMAAPSSVALPYQHPASHHGKQIAPPPSIWMPPFQFKFPVPRQDLIEVNNPPRFGLSRPRLLSGTPGNSEINILLLDRSEVICNSI
jgi:hypothetical protein